jgi:hypothetical protein
MFLFALHPDLSLKGEGILRFLRKSSSLTADIFKGTYKFSWVQEKNRK